MTKGPLDPRLQRRPMSTAEREAMTGAVLARTSGSACRRAELLMAGQPEQPLSAAASALLAEHVAHCDACRAFEAVVRDARTALASMREIAPGQAFVAGVLQRTSEKQAWATGRGWLGWPSAWELVAGWQVTARAVGQRLLARPRLSLELAYVATVVVVVMVGNPALIAEKLGARALASHAGVTAADASRRPATDQERQARPPAAATEALPIDAVVEQNVIARSWTWLTDRVGAMVDASWNWLADVVRWLDEKISGPPPATEPAKPPVRE